MPLYEYVCRKCHAKFSEVMTITLHDAKQIRCPKCKGKDVQPVVEQFFAKTSSKTRAW